MTPRSRHNGQPMSTAELVRDHLKASARVAKRIGKSKRAAREFLILAGILEKDGKRLARAYR